MRQRIVRRSCKEWSLHERECYKAKGISISSVDTKMNVHDIRFPTEDGPGGINLALTYAFILVKDRLVEQSQLVCKSDAVDPVDLTNFINAAKIVDDIEDYAGLYGRQLRNSSFHFPQTLGLGQKAIQQGSGIPILGSIFEGPIASLRDASIHVLDKKWMILHRLGPGLY